MMTPTAPSASTTGVPLELGCFHLAQRFFQFLLGRSEILQQLYFAIEVDQERKGSSRLPALDLLRSATEAAGSTLAPRLTLYPAYALDPEEWLDESMRFPVLDRSDAEGLGRDHPWCSGGEFPPPVLLAPLRAR